jgi:hypothetical protein
MAFFTIRLELNHHDNGDYDLLHVELEKEQIIRVVKGGNDVILDMPTGTYNNVSNQTTKQVFDAATNAVTRVIAKKPLNDKREKKDYELIVTRDPDGRKWKLNTNTDKSKLPKNKAILA